jgi:hypothetical protein
MNHHSIPFQVQSLIHDHNPQSPLFNNQGKVVSGKDRAGDEGTITVHPPSGGLNNTNTGIFLTGGVGLLQFHNAHAGFREEEPSRSTPGGPRGPGSQSAL